MFFIPYRRNYLNSLIPQNNLRHLHGEKYDWEVISLDPYFLAKDRFPYPGWKMIELEIDSLSSGGTARLYFDTGAGFNEEECVCLPFKSRQVIKRIYCIQKKNIAIKLVPLMSIGVFSIRHFQIVWLTPWFAHDRLIRRLINTHFDYRDNSKKQVLKKIKTEAKKNGKYWIDIAITQYDETFINKPVGTTYSHWIDNFENHFLATEFEKRLNALVDPPLISILLTTYNSDLEFLFQCIESVLRQVYTHWQLCIADDASSDMRVVDLVRDYAKQDSRIKFMVRNINGHISAASNSALSLADGDYIALLDHDDLLADQALLRVAEAIAKYPDAAIIYSDEDKVNEKNERFDPHFKPDWNPDLLLSINYISHLVVYRTSLAQGVGGFKIGVEGSQDHDLVLRCSAVINDRQIVHIPEVLYHWRAVQGSTAASADEKKYTWSAGLVAIADYLKGIKAKASVVKGLLPNTYRVRWEVPTPAPLVSLMIPTRDGYKILRRCVDSILKQTSYENYEILILDNQTRCEKTLNYLDEVVRDSRVCVHRYNRPFNYSAINNFGATLAQGNLLGLLNNDVEVINPDWLDEMVSHACRERIGCVGAKLYYPNETVQHGGVVLGIGGIAGHSHKYFSRNEYGYFSRLMLVQNLSAVTGACLLVKKSIYMMAGGLEEKNLPVAFNDVDFCLRVRELGYRNLWTPYAELYHHESLSRGTDNTPKKQARAQLEAEYMRNRWGILLDNDPAYNSNLTLSHEDFSLR